VRSPKIFISHSANDDAAAAAVLHQLTAALESNGFEVLVDRREIAFGDRWRKKIGQMLSECDGAVAVLTKKALTASQWVAYELALLSNRSLREPDQFILLPVPVGISPTQMRRHGWGDPFWLTELQMSDSATPAKLSLQVVGRLKFLLELQDTDGPCAELEEYLTDLLIGIRNETLLAKAAALLNLDLRAYPTSRARLLARRLLIVQNLPALLDAIRYLGRSTVIGSRALEFLELTVPFCWIDPHAAARISMIAGQSSEVRRVVALGLNSSQPDTPRMYVRRACPSPRCWPVLQAPSVQDGSVEGLVEDIHGMLEVALKRFQRRGGEYVQRHLQTYPHFVVLPPPPIGEDELQRVCKEFPHIIFLILAGDHTESTFLELNLSRAEFLVPALDPATEAETLFACDQLRYELEDITK
jgi:hypothetical protein